MWLEFVVRSFEILCCLCLSMLALTLLHVLDAGTQTAVFYSLIGITSISTIATVRASGIF